MVSELRVPSSAGRLGARPTWRAVIAAGIVVVLLACGIAVAVWTNPGASWATALEDLYNDEGGSSAGFGLDAIEVWAPLAGIIGVLALIGSIVVLDRAGILRAQDPRGAGYAVRLIAGSTLLVLALLAWLVSGALADHVGDYGYWAERRSAVLAFSAMAVTLGLLAAGVLLGVLRLRSTGSRLVIAIAAGVALLVSATTDPIQGFYTSAWTTVLVGVDVVIFLVGLVAVLAVAGWSSDADGELVEEASE